MTNAISDAADTIARAIVADLRRYVAEVVRFNAEDGLPPNRDPLETHPDWAALEEQIADHVRDEQAVRLVIDYGPQDELRALLVAAGAIIRHGVWGKRRYLSRHGHPDAGLLAGRLYVECIPRGLLWVSEHAHEPVAHEGPEALFGSGALREAAYAGWYAAVGDADSADVARNRAIRLNLKDAERRLDAMGQQGGGQ